MAEPTNDALTYRAILISGSDSTARHDARRQLLSAPGLDENDVSEVEASLDALIDAVGNASTLPFLGERRVVVVRNVERVEPDLAMLVPALASLPKTALMIFCEEGEDGEAKGSAKWAQAVTKGEGLVLKLSYEPKELASRLRARAKEAGCALSIAAATAIVELTSGQAAPAFSELEKLIAFVGEGGEVRTTDVREIGVADRDYEVFKLTDAVLAGKASAAIQQLAILASSSRRLDAEVVPRILPVLLSQVRLLYQAVAIEADGRGFDAPGLAEWLPAKSLASQPDWKRQKIMAVAKRFTLADVVELVSLIGETDARLKGVRPGSSQIDTIESAVFAMCRVGT